MALDLIYRGHDFADFEHILKVVDVEIADTDCPCKALLIHFLKLEPRLDILALYGPVYQVQITYDRESF